MYARKYFPETSAAASKANTKLQPAMKRDLRRDLQLVVSSLNSLSLPKNIKAAKNLKVPTNVKNFKVPTKFKMPRSFSLLGRTASPQTVAIGAGILVGGLVVGGLIYGLSRSKRAKQLKHPKHQPHHDKKLRDELNEKQVDRMLMDSFPASDPASTY